LIRYVFGALLLLAAVRLLFGKDEGSRRRRTSGCASRAPRAVHDHFDGSRFFMRHNGHVHATRLFIVLLLVEART
jgi:predicted tellurium resistance membrane protein TerC